jgi:hypothetical protein
VVLDLYDMKFRNNGTETFRFRNELQSVVFDVLANSTKCSIYKENIPANEELFFIVKH